MTIHDCLFRKYQRRYSGFKQFVINDLEKINIFIDFHRSFETIEDISFQNIKFDQLDFPKLLIAIQQTKTLVHCNFIDCQISQIKQQEILDLFKHRVSIIHEITSKLDTKDSAKQLLKKPDSISHEDITKFYPKVRGRV